jgi:hypothetical protein
MKMPEYLTPGVYMEEFEIGARPIEGVSTSTAGFLGLTERGPTEEPRLVTSFSDYITKFGGYQKDFYLPYAVEGFFNNGGKRCFIGRIVRNDAETASLAQGDLTITAVGEGAWGNRVGVRIENATNDAEDQKPAGQKCFKLTLAYWKKKLPEDLGRPSEKRERDRKWKEILDDKILGWIEVHDNLSEDPASPDNYLKKLGDRRNNLSFLVFLKHRRWHLLRAPCGRE